MATQIVCPRCKGSLMPNARACPRCGLLLPSTPYPAATETAHTNSAGTGVAPATLPSYTTTTSPRTTSAPKLLDNGEASAQSDFPIGRIGQTGPTIIRGGQTGPLAPRGQTGPLPSRTSTGPLTPRGALELLPGESVAYQLGALYLTTKRVILLAPSVVRSAFVRDIDAVGTFTEKSSVWLLALGILMLAASGGLIYITLNPLPVDSFPFLYVVPPWTIGLALGLLALFVMLRFFFWTKRTLFVSVKGRPLITVSISDWSQKKLDGMDEFVNAFFQIKDFMTGELAGAMSNE